MPAFYKQRANNAELLVASQVSLIAIRLHAITIDLRDLPADRFCSCRYRSSDASIQRLSGFGVLSLDVDTLSHPRPLNCCAEAGSVIAALKPAAPSANRTDCTDVFIGIPFHLSTCCLRYPQQIFQGIRTQHDCCVEHKCIFPQSTSAERIRFRNLIAKIIFFVQSIYGELSKE
jgi:hypothetical protein